MYWIKYKVLPFFSYYLRGGEGSCYHGRLRFTSKESAEKWIQRFEIERRNATRDFYKIVECKSKARMMWERLLKILIFIIFLILLIFFKSQVIFFLKYSLLAILVVTLFIDYFSHFYKHK